jgi:hypothetical protein
MKDQNLLRKRRRAMNIQKELNLKTDEQVSITFDVFTGTDASVDSPGDVRVGRAFDMYFLVEEGVTTPLRIKIQKQVEFDMKGTKVFKDFGDPEEVIVSYTDVVFGLNLAPDPIFDRLVVSSEDGIGGDVVHVLLKIL